MTACQGLSGGEDRPRWPVCISYSNPSIYKSSNDRVKYYKWLHTLPALRLQYSDQRNYHDAFDYDEQCAFSVWLAFRELT